MEQVKTIALQRLNSELTAELAKARNGKENVDASQRSEEGLQEQAWAPQPQ